MGCCVAYATNSNTKYRWFIWHLPTAIERCVISTLGFDAIAVHAAHLSISTSTTLSQSTRFGQRDISAAAACTVRCAYLVNMGSAQKVFINIGASCLHKI